MADHGFRTFLREPRWQSRPLALFASKDVSHHDTGLYHLPQINWLVDHGLVTGLGLLHHRLGLNSIWLALVAPIVGAEQTGSLVGIGGSIAMTMLVFHGIYSATRIACREGTPADWYLLAAILPGVFATAIMSLVVSSSPDLAVFALIIVFGWLLLFDRTGHGGLIVFLLAVGAVAIKLSAAPLLLGAVVYIIATRTRNIRSFATFGLFSAISLGAVLYANFATSGCLMLPASITCLPVPWGIPADTASAIAGYISNWPFKGDLLGAIAQDIAGYAQGQLTPTFMARIPELIATDVAFWIFVVTSVILACFSAFRFRSKAAFVLLMTGLAGLTYCISVPSYRFAIAVFGRKMSPRSHHLARSEHGRVLLVAAVDNRKCSARR